jgi:hypothetical protein
MKEIGIYALALAGLCFVGVLILSVYCYKLENRVFELECGENKIRDDVFRLKFPPEKVQTNPLTGRPHRLIEYVEPEATR